MQVNRKPGAVPYRHRPVQLKEKRMNSHAIIYFSRCRREVVVPAIPVPGHGQSM